MVQEKAFFLSQSELERSDRRRPLSPVTTQLRSGRALDQGELAAAEIKAVEKVPQSNNRIGPVDAKTGA